MKETINIINLIIPLRIHIIVLVWIHTHYALLGAKLLLYCCSNHLIFTLQELFFPLTIFDILPESSFEEQGFFKTGIH